MPVHQRIDSAEAYLRENDERRRHSASLDSAVSGAGGPLWRSDLSSDDGHGANKERSSDGPPMELLAAQLQGTTGGERQPPPARAGPPTTPKPSRACLVM